MSTCTVTSAKLPKVGEHLIGASVLVCDPMLKGAGTIL